MLKLQTDGFIEDGKVRKIPFEIKVIGDKAPIYGETLEDLGRFNEDPQLPFNAYGTLALARQEFEANSGSSQVFWLLKVRDSCQLMSRPNQLHSCQHTPQQRQVSSDLNVDDLDCFTVTIMAVGVHGYKLCRDRDHMCALSH